MRADDGKDYRPKLQQKFIEQTRLNNVARERELKLFRKLGEEIYGKFGKAFEEKMIEVLDHAIDILFQKYEEQFGKIALQTTPKTEPIPAPYKRIERRLCAVFHVAPNEIRSHRRKKEIMLARQAVMYWAVRLTGYSYPKIGQIMGGRDHTSIMSGVTAYRQKREKWGVIYERQGNAD